jgi:GAF domain-containing protein
MAGQQEQLFAALQSFAATLAGDYDVVDVLHRVCDHLVDVLDAAGAGVTLYDAEGNLRFAAATDAAVIAAEKVQEETQEGPCTECLASGQPVAVGDIGADRRWPEYRAVLHAQSLRSVVALPLVVRDQRIGAVDVYDQAPRRWSESDVAAAEVLAQMATAYVIRANLTAEAERLNEQLQRALDSRIVIEQAKGKLAGERSIDMDAAFAVIRGYARSHNQTVRQVAEGVVAGSLELPSAAQRERDTTG